MRKYLHKISLFFNKYYVILISLLSCLMVLNVVLYSFIPHIYLNDGNITITLGSNYDDPGYSAHNFYKNIKNDVKVKNNIDINKVGQYKVEYHIGHGLFSDYDVRYVDVVDANPPIIENFNEGTLKICPGKNIIDVIKEEKKYKASDNYDGDITDRIVFSSEMIDDINGKIKYLVSDSSSNKSEIYQDFMLTDQDSPVIKLNGSYNQVVLVGNNYYDPGYTAYDNCDLDITDKVIVSGYVDTNNTGYYSLKYTINDNNGNSTSVTRYIRVITPDTVNNRIYLTFDDGPSFDITPTLLDYLKEEGVKATFFIINFSQNQEYLIKRIVNEGHTIAIHGYSHDYNQIYSSSSAFWNNVYTLKDKIKNLTGVDSVILRFPGGSSNTVSRFNPGIMSTLVREANEKGFSYFDWNVSSGDAGGASNSNDVYNNVVNNLGYYRSNVVLMHDFSGNYKTLYAVKDIIKFGRDNGYGFYNITNDTPMITHRVNN